MQVAEILAIESSENVEAILFPLTNVGEGAGIRTEFHAW
jgi:hypothetical protein